MTSTWQSLVEDLERDRSLFEPNRLRRRIEALDRLEDYLIEPSHQHDDARLQERARAIYTDLEAINRVIYEDIRRDIQHGAGAAKLLTWLPDVALNDGGASGEGYDYLDVLLSGVLQFEEPSDGIAALAPDMVFYQPTPARHIFDLLDRLSLGEQDVLIDLGSGLGHVSLLTAICTNARCVGIELEPAYIACAQQCAKALNLHNASFVQQDVRAADLSRGSVFYLYTPFTGALLREVLDMLRREATKRDLRICTLGPCTSVVAGEAWLSLVGTLDVNRVTVFRNA